MKDKQLKPRLTRKEWRRKVNRANDLVQSRMYIGILDRIENIKQARLKQGKKGKKRWEKESAKRT